MRSVKLLACLLAIAAAQAHAYPGMLRDLENASRTCPKQSTPEALAACGQKSREHDAALERQQRLDREKAKALEPNFKAKAQPEKPSGLCFKRQATGEVVCPN